MERLLGIVGVLALTACAGATQQQPSPVLVAEGPSVQRTDVAPTTMKTTLAVGVGDEAKPEAKEEAPESVPTTCGGETSFGTGAKETKLCVPAASYAKKLCGGIYPEVALRLFAKGTPWSRIYLAGDVEAWNASGGLTHRAHLAFDEEVIVLAKHAAAGSGGIVMTGAMASYDVMRWDGTCVSVMEGELTTSKPPKPKPAAVPWSRLEEMTRQTLLTSPKVKSSREELTKACSGSEKTKCEKADKAFSQAIVDLVRGGVTLPTPARRP